MFSKYSGVPNVCPSGKFVNVVKSNLTPVFAVFPLTFAVPVISSPYAILAMFTVVVIVFVAKL